MNYIPFYNCLKCREKKRCTNCNQVITNNVNYNFCDKSCEILHIYKDSFQSLDGSLHKFLLNIDYT